MDFNDLLVMLGLQTASILLLLLFFRFSIQKLVNRITQIESQIRQLSLFFGKISQSQKEIRKTLNENTPFQAIPEESLEKNSSHSHNPAKTSELSTTITQTTAKTKK